MELFNKIPEAIVRKEKDEIILSYPYDIKKYIKEEQEKLEKLEENYITYLKIYIEVFEKIYKKQTKKYVIEINSESISENETGDEYMEREEKGKKMAIQSFMDMLKRKGYKSQLENVEATLIEKRKWKILIEQN